MRVPEILNPVFSFFARFTSPTRLEKSITSPENRLPNPCWAEHNFKICFALFTDPRPAVDNEPLPTPRSLRCRPALYPSDDLFRHRARGFFVSREVHRIRRSTLGRRPHVRGVSEHLGQRHDRLDYLRTSAVLHTLNASATRTQVPHNRAREILGHHDFD